MAVPFDVLINIIEKHFPISCAYDWDNSGIQLKLSDEVSGVLIALDLTPMVVQEAIDKGCDMILTHHPALFRHVKKLVIDDPVTGTVLKAAKAGISIYSAHTSCDCAPEGLNYELAKVLSLRSPEIFAIDGCQHESGGLGVKGLLHKKMNETELIEHIKTSLGVSSVRCAGIKGEFEKIAVIGGSAGEFYAEAVKQGIDVLITGEAKHNEFVEAYVSGVLLIAAGHYDTEKMFLNLAERKIRQTIIDEGCSLKVEIAYTGDLVTFVQ